MKQSKEVVFSILTPAYNAAETLARCIESVQAQTFSSYEHVIVDDGSTDNTLEIATGYASNDARIKVFSAAHSGLPATRLRTMEEATGLLFARLDADDELLPPYLEEVHAVFLAQPDIDIVSTNGYHVHDESVGSSRRIPYYTDGLLAKECSLSLLDMLQGNVFGTSAVMRKEVLTLTGGPRFEARSEDFDLWLRAAALGAKHCHLPANIFLYHQGKNQMSKDSRKVWKSHIEIYTYLLDNFSLDAEEQKLARAAIAKLRLRLFVHWDVWGMPLRLAMKRAGAGDE